MTFTASHRSSYVLLLAPLFFLLLLSSVSDMMLFDDDGLEIVRNRACLLIRTELGSDVGWLENKFLLLCACGYDEDCHTVMATSGSLLM